MFVFLKGKKELSSSRFMRSDSIKSYFVFSYSKQKNRQPSKLEIVVDSTMCA